MKKKLTTIPFKGTQAQEAQLDELIAKNKGIPGALMPVLQGAQEIYGYLPQEIIRHIALGMDKSVSEVYGVASFYSQFSLTPKGEFAVSICLGTACYVKGSGKLMEEFEKELVIKAGETTAYGKFSLTDTRCIGACGLAPVLTVNSDVYGRLTPAEVKGIVDKYR